ncbi:Peptidase C14 caspase domain-containing protein [Pleurotus pulmonarius]
MWYPKRLLYWSIYKMTPSGNTKHKALLIGISDDGSGQPLSVGPRNDVKKMRKLLRETYSYKNSDIVVMYDKQRDPKLVPTRENILREIDNLVAGCKAGDHIVFHYSGHSGQQDNLDGTEKDGKDERIETKTGPILDDELRARLIDPLCPGAQLVAVLDTCHSETLLDLPHVECQSPPLSPDKHTVKETIKEDMRVTINDLKRSLRRSKRRPARQPSSKLTKSKKPRLSLKVLTRSTTRSFNKVRGPLTAFLPKTNSVFSPDLIQPNSDFYGEYCCHKECSPLEKDQVRKEVSELAQVLAISSCKDSQYSYEDAEGKGMTDVLCCYLKNNPHPTVEKLFNVICFSLFTPAWDRIHSEGWDEYRREFDEDALPNAYQEPSLSSLQRLNLEHTLSL